MRLCLEEFSFEIRHKQSQASLNKRARYLIERGGRRVFAIYVRAQNWNDEAQNVIAGPVKEWSGKDNQWLELADDAYIEDPCWHRPVSVCAFLEAVAADNAVVRALLDKGNPVLRELKADSYDQGKADGYDQGKADGLRQAIRALCQAFVIPLTPERNTRLAALATDELQAVLEPIQTHHSWSSG